MKNLFSIVIFLISNAFIGFAQHCMNPGYNIPTNNTITTINLTGDCDGPFNTNTKNFEYSFDNHYFIIQTRFNKNCARTGYITVQANDTDITIIQHTEGDGPLAICEDYDKYQLYFPIPNRGFYKINYNNSNDTIVSISTDLEKNTLSESISVFPNPSEDKINISNLSGKNEILLYNSSGELKLKAYSSSESHIIQLSEFTSGIYLLVINDKKSNTNRHKEKVIVR